MYLRSTDRAQTLSRVSGSTSFIEISIVSSGEFLILLSLANYRYPLHFTVTYSLCIFVPLTELKPYPVSLELPVLSKYLSYRPLGEFLVSLPLSSPFHLHLHNSHRVDLVSPNNVELWCSTYRSLTLASVTFSFDRNYLSYCNRRIFVSG